MYAACETCGDAVPDVRNHAEPLDLNGPMLCRRCARIAICGHCHLSEADGGHAANVPCPYIDDEWPCKASGCCGRGV